jgi:enterochelin esterase-like enzyme
MKHPVGWTIAPGPSGRTAGLVVCLHGKGEDHRMAFDLGLPAMASSLGLPLGVAAVDGGPDSYWHRRADGTDALAMLLQEFVPMIERRLPGVPKAIMGWSMGGYGALLAAERSPDQWRAVAATSPALWTSPGGTAPGAFDSSADYRSYDIWTGLDGLGRMVVRLDCGTGDPFYSATRKLDAKLAFPHQAVFGPGHHDHAYWRRVAPAQLQAIALALGAS